MSHKKSKPAPVRTWRVSLIGKSPMKYLGRYDAPDQRGAIDAAAKENRISEAAKFKLVAERAD